MMGCVVGGFEIESYGSYLGNCSLGVLFYGGCVMLKWLCVVVY